MTEPQTDEPTPRHDLLTQIVRAGLAEHGIGEPTRTEKRDFGQKFQADAAKYNVPENHLEWIRRRAGEEAEATRRAVTANVYAGLLANAVPKDDAMWVSVMAGAAYGQWVLFWRGLEHVGGWRTIIEARRRRKRGEKQLRDYIPKLAAVVRACPDQATDIRPDGSPYGPNANEISNFIGGVRELTAEDVKGLSESYMTLNVIYSTELEHHRQTIRDVEGRMVVIGRSWAAKRSRAAAEGALPRLEGSPDLAKLAVSEGALALALHDDLDESLFSNLYAACDMVLPAQQLGSIDPALVEATKRWRTAFGAAEPGTRAQKSAQAEARPTKFLIDPRDSEQVEWLIRQLGLDDESPRSGS